MVRWPGSPIWQLNFGPFQLFEICRAPLSAPLTRPQPLSADMISILPIPLLPQSSSAPRFLRCDPGTTAIENPGGLGTLSVAFKKEKQK
jgi:hypothetical protein